SQRSYPGRSVTSSPLQVTDVSLPGTGFAGALAVALVVHADVIEDMTVVAVVLVEQRGRPTLGHHVRLVVGDGAELEVAQPVTGSVVAAVHDHHAFGDGAVDLGPYPAMDQPGSTVHHPLAVAVLGPSPHPLPAAVVVGQVGHGTTSASSW